MGVVVLVAVLVVAFFVVGMSLTLIIKGRHMESEVGENRHMKERGITCASAQIRQEEAILRGEHPDNCQADLGGCGSCTVGDCSTGNISCH